MTFGVAELIEVQKRTERQVQRPIDHIGKVVGDLLEIKYRDKPSPYFGRIVHRARTIDLAKLEDLPGERLTKEPLFDLLQLDLVKYSPLSPIVNPQKYAIALFSHSKPLP